MNKGDNMEEFIKFAEKFNLNDSMIKLKYDHSFRVQKLCETIAKDEKLPENEIALAKLIGLLHDYGRFYQWNLYHTYDDTKSVDHADLGVQKLFDEDEIKKYWPNKEDYQTIKNAIKYHNKYSLPENLKENTLCKIIKDADKLDILYLCTINDIKTKEGGEVTSEIKKDFYNHKLIDRNKMKSEVDNVISRLAFIYDLNFYYSFEYLKNNEIIEKLFNNIENKEKVKPYFDEINKYIKEKLEVIKC